MTTKLFDDSLEHAIVFIMRNVDDDESCSDDTLTIKIEKDSVMRSVMRRIKRYYREHDLSMSKDMKEALILRAALHIEKREETIK